MRTFSVSCLYPCSKWHVERKLQVTKGEVWVVRGSAYLNLRAPCDADSETNRCLTFEL